MMRAFHAIRRLRDRRGIAAVEFAVALPVLAVALTGVIDIAQYVAVGDRLQRVAAETASFASQFERLSNSMKEEEGAVGILFVAARENAKPLNLLAQDLSKDAEGGMIVTCVTDQGKGPVIAWQKASGTQAANSRLGVGQGGAATLPTGFTLRAGDSALFVELNYWYRPYVLSGPLRGLGNPLEVVYARSVFRPRLGALTKLDS